MESKGLSRKRIVFNKGGIMMYQDYLYPYGYYNGSYAGQEFAFTNYYIVKPTDTLGSLIHEIMISGYSILYTNEKQYLTSSIEAESIIFGKLFSDKRENSFGKRVFQNVVRDYSKDPLEFLANVPVYYTPIISQFPYPYVCGGTIISPAYTVNKISSLIGVNLGFANRFINIQIDKHWFAIDKDRHLGRIDLRKNRLNHLLQIALSVKASSMSNRSVIYITDSKIEDHTSDLFGDKFIVSQDKINRKTSNTLVTRIADTHELYTYLEQEIKQEFNKNKEKWKDLQLALTESAAILKYSLEMGDD